MNLKITRIRVKDKGEENHLLDARYVNTCVVLITQLRDLMHASYCCNGHI